MKCMEKPLIIFISVQNNASKLDLISTKSLESLQTKKRLLITTPNLRAANYIDLLLWKSPEDSFIPHIVSDMPTNEWIVITLQNQVNNNQASRIINLCNETSPLYSSVEEVYELYDETHPEKLQLSQQKLQFYKSLGLNPTIIKKNL